MGRPQTNDDVLNDVARFVERSRWRFASTLPWWPHSYTVRDWHREAGTEADFERVVALVREHGTPGRFGQREFVYLHVTVGGERWRLWSMGAPVEETTVLNRARVDAEGRLIRKDGTLLRAPREEPAQTSLDLERAR